MRRFMLALAFLALLAAPVGAHVRHAAAPSGWSFTVDGVVYPYLPQPLALYAGRGKGQIGAYPWLSYGYYVFFTLWQWQPGVGKQPIPWPCKTQLPKLRNATPPFAGYAVEVLDTQVAGPYFNLLDAIAEQIRQATPTDVGGLGRDDVTIWRTDTPQPQICFGRGHP
jgi:hypothetical protein